MNKKLIAGLSGLLFMTSCGVLGGALGSEGGVDGTSGATSKTATTSQTPAETPAANDDILSSVLGALGGKGATTTADGGATSNQGVVGGILSSVLGAFKTVSEDNLIGTWNYEGSAFVFESENALATLGSDVMAKQVSAKVDGYLTKIGIKPGACSITFAEDNTCNFNMGGKGISGTYQYNKSNKSLAFSFGVVKTTAQVVYEGGNINIVFQSDGLLKIMKAVSSASSKGTLQLLGTLLQNYDGLRMGMSFSKGK